MPLAVAGVGLVQWDEEGLSATVQEKDQVVCRQRCQVGAERRLALLRLRIGSSMVWTGVSKSRQPCSRVPIALWHCGCELVVLGVRKQPEALVCSLAGLTLMISAEAVAV